MFPISRETNPATRRRIVLRLLSRPAPWDTQPAASESMMPLNYSLPPLDQVDPESLGSNADDVVDALYDMVLQAYEQLEAKVGSETMRQVERWIILRSIDSRW